MLKYRLTSSFIWLAVVCLMVGLLCFAGGSHASSVEPEAKADAPPAPDAATKAKLGHQYGKLPISFVANEGQTDERVKYMSRGTGYSLFLTADEAVLVFTRAVEKQSTDAKAANAAPTPEQAGAASQRVLRMQLVGASNHPGVTPLEELPGKVNYLVGSDASQWRTNLPTFAKVQFEEIYPGINLVYYGNQRRLEYDFVVAPGADPRLITLQLAGADQLKVNDNGDLLIDVAGDQIKMHKPFVYQLAKNGEKQEVAGRFVVKSGGRVVFDVKKFDSTKALIIDPVLAYSTEIGSGGSEFAYGIAVDSSGSAYITGSSNSGAFPTTPGSLKPVNAFGGNTFVTKLNPEGTALVYSTFLGGNGSGQEIGNGIAVDSSGSAYVTGYTRSADFPTVNPVRGSSGNLLKSDDGGANWLGKNVGGIYDAVNVLAIDPLSTNIVYAGVGYNNTVVNSGIYKSTDGGNSWSALNTGLTNAACSSIVIDPSNSSVLYAALTPSNSSGSSGVYKSTDGGTSWSFVSSGLDSLIVTVLAIDPTNPSILYAGTQFGVYKTTTAAASWSKFSTGITFGGFTAIMIDRTTPATVYASAGGGGVFKTTNGGANWAQVNTGLTSTTVRSMVIDPVSPSTLYAGTVGGGVFKTVNAGANWAAVNTGLPANTTGYSLVIHPTTPATIYVGTNTGKIFKTTNGGGNWAATYETLTSKIFNALAINPGSPSVVFAGSNSSATSSLNDYEAFVSKLNPQGSALQYSTYLGGSGDDFGQSIAVDSGGNAYVTGRTASTGFTLLNAFQATLKGSQDAFVTKFTPTGALVYSTYLGGTNLDAGNGIAADASGSAYLTGNTFSSDFPLMNPIAGTGGSIFVTKLNQTGTALAYSTLLGGGTGYSIAVDTAGSAYVTGNATSGFPVTPGAFQTDYHGGCCGAAADDAFVSKLNPAGDALVYSTYLGGSDSDTGRGIALDNSGNAYVAGITRSADYPLAVGTLRSKSPFYKSTDGAASWNNENFGIKGEVVTALALVPTTPSTIYAGTRSGVFKSTDSGNSWVALTNGLPAAAVSAIVVDPLTPSTVYVSNGTVYKSTNGGSSWSAASTGLTAGSVCLTIDPNNPSILYSGTYANGVYKTVNGGGNWSAINNGLNGQAVRAIAVDPTNSSVLYAGSEFSNGGLFKSTDGGASWSAAQTGIVGSVLTLVIDPTNTSIIYASGSNGAFKSINAAASWNPMPVITTPSAGISTVSGSIALDPSNTATIYLVANASTGNNGIYKSTNGGSSWTFQSALPRNPIIGPLVVNPLRPSTLYAGVNVFPSSEETFVTKLNASGSALNYSTLLGARYAFGIAVDTAGSAYVTGLTNTSDIPVTPDSYQPFHLGFDEAFIAKLSMSYVISGLVLDGNGQPLVDAEVTLSGSQLKSVFTESDGSYRFTNLPEGGSFTVSAAKAHYSFTPPSQSFSNLNANQTANFTAATTNAPFYTISGRITSGGLGLAGASVTLGGSQVGITSTDSNGNYSFTVPGGGNYTVTPSILGFNLSPGPQTFNNLSANQTADFAGARLNFVVTNTNDHGAGSLRQAILDANATAGADTIVFNIPGSGVQTIADRVALPDITDPLTIDGTTQPGFSGTPIIELSGSKTPGGPGLKITAGNSIVRGLIINNFKDNGIYIVNGGGNLIQGNYIGLDSTGTQRRANHTGIAIGDSSNNIIGGLTPGARNVISANGFAGITINSSSNNQVQGNFIGTNAAGTAALGNTGRGVEISGLPPSGNLIGGTAPGAGNLISGNQTGVYLQSAGNTVQGNLIGTDVTGTQKVGNGQGIQVSAANNLIGGTAAGARNIISGNDGGGVSMGIGSNGSALQGNFIGTDISGTAALGNGSNGVDAGSNTLVGGTTPAARNIISANGGFGNIALGYNSSGDAATVQGNYIGTDVSGNVALENPGNGITIFSVNNIIGGTSPAMRNIISGNRDGIQIGGSTTATITGTVIKGNYIGLNATGDAPLPNTGSGIVFATATNNTVGGTEAGAANVIAFNKGVGVHVSSGTENAVRGNNIFSNSLLGVDLASIGVLANDALDADTGANNLQNFPVLTSVASNGAGTTIQGSLNSKPNTTFNIDFYSNAACDPSGSGEGARYFDSTQVTTDQSGNASINVNFPTPLPTGRVITATATDPAGNTSEFSSCNSAEATGSIEFGAAVFNVLEDVGSAAITVVRTGGSRGTLTVNYSTGGGTATPGADYTPASGTLTFADGETSKTFVIPVVNDGITEADETVQLTLNSLSGIEVLGANGSAVMKIQDAATPLTLYGLDMLVAEGNSGTTNALVTVYLSAATGRTVSVSYNTSESGGARAGLDFQAVSGTLTFAPGVTTQTLTVPIIGDTLDEFDESFTIALSNPVNASTFVLPRVFISDDDDAPTISISDVSISEGNAGTTTAVLPVSLSSASGKTVRVNYATANGSATAGSDYVATSGLLTFAPGETTKNVSVTVNGDTTAESNETFLVNLTFPTNAPIARAQGVGTIVNDDAATGQSSLQFSQAAYSLTEDGRFFEVTVTRTGDLSSPASVNFATSNATADTRTDYTAVAGTLNFAAQASTKRIFIPVTDDLYDEVDEMLTLSLSNPSGAILGSPSFATLTIQDNDTGTPTTNPLDDAQFFVRQQYHDFLNRPPDQGGLDYWSSAITSCNGESVCVRQRRTAVSAAFFIELEFRETGFFVYLLHKAARGHRPTYTEFMADRPRVVQGPEAEASKVALINDLMQRSFFTDSYPSTMTPEEYVDKLNFNAGGALSQAERDALVQGMYAQTETRATVLRKVVADTDFQSVEDQPSFVLMQYFGYLRRDPDEGGYQFWLGILRQNPANLKVMVCAFITSPEYQQRFSPVVTRVDSECSVITP